MSEDRTCIVLSLVLFEEFRHGFEDVLGAIKSYLSAQEAQILTHDHVLRDFECIQMEEEEAQEEEDKDQPRLLLICSVDSSALLKVEKLLPIMWGGCCSNGEPLVKRGELWITSPCLLPLFKETLASLEISGVTMVGNTQSVYLSMLLSIWFKKKKEISVSLGMQENQSVVPRS
jgi:hypothetical protein